MTEGTSVFYVIEKIVVAFFIIFVLCVGVLCLYLGDAIIDAFPQRVEAIMGVTILTLLGALLFVYIYTKLG